MVLEGAGALLLDTAEADVLTTAMWFLFALIVLVVFRKPVSALVRQVEEIRFRDLTIDTDAVDEAARSHRPDGEDAENYKNLAERTPRYAVREGWAVLEGVLGDLPAPDDLQTFRSQVRKLEEQGVISREDREAFDALRSAVAQVKEPGSTRVDASEAATLAQCGVGLAHHLAGLDEDEVREALNA